MIFIIDIPDETAAGFAFAPILGSPAAAFIARAALSAGAVDVRVYCDEPRRREIIGRETDLSFVSAPERDDAVSNGATVFVPDGLLPPDKYGNRLAYRNAYERAETAGILKREINTGFLAGGVFILDPENTYIGPCVRIGAGTVIYPGNVLEGRTVIGADCELGVGNRIRSSVLGDGCGVQYTVITDSLLADGVKIGPFCHIRPGSKIARGVKIGDFVEVKNSGLGEGTKVPHLSYIGDSDVGARVNFGCGCVTVNYDGDRKQRTKIGDDVFIGCNANMIAPAELGDGSYIAAGSTIDRDVPAGAFAIARARQVIKETWIPPNKRGGNPPPA